MTNVPGDSIRRALLFIDEARKDDPKRRLADLIGEASMRYNLSPAEEEWLFRTLTTSTSRK